jgi:hypothetical protein
MVTALLTKGFTESLIVPSVFPFVAKYGTPFKAKVMVRKKCSTVVHDDVPEFHTGEARRANPRAKISKRIFRLRVLSSIGAKVDAKLPILVVTVP